MYGVDLGYYKQELTLRRPLFMHTVFHYKDAGAYRIASKHCRRRLKQELVTNKKLQQQIDYATGEIVYKQCAFRRCATYSNETDLHKYALDVYRTIRNYNQCIIVNFSQKNRSLYVLLNHTFMDGVKMANMVCCRILFDLSPIDMVLEYRYVPVVSEMDALRCIGDYVTRRHRSTLTHTPGMPPVQHYLQIDNTRIKTLKKSVGSSFNIALLAMVCEYLFKHTIATSMSVALLYGFSNPDKNNAYTFIDIIVVQTDDIVASIRRINEQIKSRMHHVNGHYHLIHNMNLDLESVYKQGYCDVIFSSAVRKTKRNVSSVFGYCHNQRTPFYVGCANTYTASHTSISINALTNSCSLRSNDYRDPVVLSV